MKHPRIHIANAVIVVCVIYIAGTLAPIIAPFFELPIKEQMVIAAIVAFVSSLAAAAYFIYRAELKKQR